MGRAWQGGGLEAKVSAGWVQIWVSLRELASTMQLLVCRISQYQHRPPGLLLAQQLLLTVCFFLPIPAAGEKDVTTGASSDLEQATRLARAMVTRYGMSDRIGQVGRSGAGRAVEGGCCLRRGVPNSLDGLGANC